MATLVGKKAPLFVAKAVCGEEIISEFRLADYLGKYHLVLFFYPKDFTFVCPTELHAFQDHLEEFEKRNVQIIACSTDTEFCHHAWLQTPRQRGGIQGVTYPIVADINKTVARDYGVLAGECGEDGCGNSRGEGEAVAYRGLFLIDREGMVQQETVNHMVLGRNVEEVLRMVDALQFVERNGEVCPANWHRGSRALKPTWDGLADYFSH
jgi:peroxiredoxin (alkyl hydroperoxide reductase subunit C)